ncbi:lytic murein transglycosylase [Paralimibaculum aggregatum]|uniref:Lytic murein transglycosylase n=2 Tax=Paralimibaculum aggregatum TaxID=3036245 RepID=A0ABQ6LKH3_9RHOB|nr:lytic murein transglycosylase [Limibaculum sp. NKW23]
MAGGCAGAQETSPIPPARPDAKVAAMTAEAGSAGEAVPMPPVSPAGFEAWRDGFRARALGEGISAATFDAAFAGVEIDPDIVRLDRHQPEFTRRIWKYLDSAVSPTRIANGRGKAAEQAAALAEIEAEYGVDRAAVVAIWGLESAYGAVKGSTPVMRGLATLAYDGRRRAFFEIELLAALRILEAREIAPAGLIGSWAGAMGHTQLLPSNYLRYGVDVTGDGRRDIWGADPRDALGSTANYLKSFGWTLGQPAVRRITLPAGFDYGLADQSVRRPVAEWQAMGIRAADGSALPAAAEVAVLLPAGAAGPAWLAYPNFRVIKRYNNATAYALGISLLAQEISGEGMGVAGLDWPRGDRPLTRDEKMLLQRSLTAQGFDTQGVDGRIGPNTQKAVRAFQAAAGLTPDGYVTEALLKRVVAGG